MLRERLTFVSVACASTLIAMLAFAQAANYSSIEVFAGTVLRIGYHASANKNCTPAALPAIRMLQPPKFGTVTVRPAILTTNKIVGCPNLKTPAQTLYYHSRVNYKGPDRVVYEVKVPSGDIATYDITIEVKPGQHAPPKGKDTDL